MRRPVVLCVMAVKSFICGQMTRERSLREPKMARKRLLELSRNNIAIALDEFYIAHKVDREKREDLLKKYSLLSWTPFLGKFTASGRVNEERNHLPFEFKTMRNLHLRIFKLLKEYSVKYLLSDRLRKRKP